MPPAVEPRCLIPSTFEQVTVGTSASLLSALLTGGIPAGTKTIIFYPETNDVRWRADGTAPTSSVGMVLKGDEQAVFDSQPEVFEHMSLIAASSTLMNVHCFT